MTKKRFNNKNKQIITHNIGCEASTVDKLYYLLAFWDEETKENYIESKLVRHEDIISYLSIEEISKTLDKSSRAVQSRLQNTLDALFIVCEKQFKDQYNNFIVNAGILTNPANGKKCAGIAADSSAIVVNTPQEYSVQNHLTSNKHGGEKCMKVHAEVDVETGRVGLISKCFGGSIHDKTISETIYLERDQYGKPIVDSNDKIIFKHQDYPILGDKAYQGMPSFITPYKRSKHLTDEQLDHNAFINQNRIKVENFFCRLKRFKVLSTSYRGSLHNLDKIVLVLAYVVDLENPNRYDTDFEFKEEILNEIQSDRKVLLQKKVKKTKLTI
ncbi:hypothetical protein ACTFIY_006694 [Dictyostelium cf. discoideum]